MTKDITINGICVNLITEDFTTGKVDVLFTSDDTGETLSLTFCEAIQISVPFEQVQALINETRNARLLLVNNEIK